MILAGVDEAGYGPLLGPLVVGCSAFAIDDVPADAGLPCLWKRLRKVVGKSRSKDGRRIHVNDSKLVYSPSTGLKELERSILAITASWDAWPAGLDAFVSRVASHAAGDLCGYPWYAAHAGERFPVEQDALPVQLFANALKTEMARAGVRPVYLAARVVCEGQLNRLFDATRNKSNVLFSTAAIHLDALIRAHGHDGLVIFCDRQGGREHYGPLLRLMFDDWSLSIEREKDGHSEYRLLRGPHVVRLIFCEKAEAQCLPVAVASMLSKYLRETLMRRFNAYWRTHLPSIEPTAGYHGDGNRFLEQINPRRFELGFDDAMLVRSR